MVLKMFTGSHAVFFYAVYFWPCHFFQDILPLLLIVSIKMMFILDSKVLLNSITVCSGVQRFVPLVSCEKIVLTLCISCFNVNGKLIRSSDGLYPLVSM